jgi:hypothetical protein
VSTADQPTLFGEIPAEPVRMPRLPERTFWRAHTAGVRDRCDYCLMVMIEQDAMNIATPPVRRPTWERTGSDGAVLLLCDAHADQMADPGSTS